MREPVGSNGFVDDREAYVGHPQWRDQPLGGLYWRLVLGRDFPSSEQEKREAAARKAAEAA